MQSAWITDLRATTVQYRLYVRTNHKQEFLGKPNRLLSFDTTRTTQKTKKLWGTQTHRQPGGLISYLLFFQNKENRLKITDRFLCFHYAMSVTRHATQRKHGVQDFIYCSVCICCLGNVLSNRYLATIERDTQKHNQQGHLKSLLLSFQIKESRLGMKH